MSNYRTRIETGHSDGRKLEPRNIGEEIARAFAESGESTLVLMKGPDLGGGQNLTIFTPRKP